MKSDDGLRMILTENKLMLEWVFIKLKFFKDLLDQQNQGSEWNLKEKTHGSSAEAKWVKKTCPEGGQVSTGVWKPRQSPSEVGLRPRQSVSKGWERSIMTPSFLPGTVARASCLGLSYRVNKDQLLSLEIENQILNPVQASVKPDNLQMRRNLTG